MIKSVNINNKQDKGSALNALLEARLLASMEADRIKEEAEALQLAELEAKKKEIEAKIYGNKKTALYVNEYAMANRRSRISTFCLWSGSTSEALEAYGLPVEPEAVREYTLHPEKLRAAIIESEVSQYGFGSDPYYKGYLKQKVSENASQLAALQPRTDEARLMEGTESLTTWNAEEKAFEVNEEALIEAFTVYAEGQAAYLWECLCDATDILNSVFDGRAPMAIGQLWQIRPEEGVLHLRPDVNLRLWCKDPTEELLALAEEETGDTEELDQKPKKKASKK